MSQGPMKKEILFIKDSSMFLGDCSNKIIIIQDFPGIRNGNDLDITSYDVAGNLCWSVWTYSYVYTIFDMVTKSFLDMREREEFLEKIKHLYPGDFDFFLWNPEIFNGQFND